jgi:rhodanese-related sulfurtransferase
MSKHRPFFLFLFVFLLALAACGGASAPKDAAPDLASLPVEITVAQAAALLDNPDVVFIDVREQDEYDAGHIPGVKLIPLGSVPARMSEIPKDKTVVAVCRSGNRSTQATQFLRDQGFDNVHNMAGGMNQWSQAGYKVER